MISSADQERGDQKPFVWRGGTIEPADLSLEAVVGKRNFQHPWFLRKGAERAKIICRVGLGTGFLIGPSMLMTNWHVLRQPDWAVGEKATFGYEQSDDGGFAAVTKYDLAPQVFYYSNEALDFAVVSVAGAPGELNGFVDLADNRRIRLGTRVNIIQHPEGGLKQIAIRDNEIRYADDAILQYWTDTEHGSSGSPLFDDKWDIVGLHYRHRQGTEADGAKIIFNEGFVMAKIVDDLRRKYPELI